MFRTRPSSPWSNWLAWGLLVGVLAGAARAAEETLITTAREVLNLPKAEAERGRPVRLRAMVHGHDKINGCLYVQDLSAGIRIRADVPGPFATRALVEIEGRTGHAYSPEVIATRVTPLPGVGMRFWHNATSTLRQLHDGKLECQWVRVLAQVREAATVDGRIQLKLSDKSGTLPAAFLDHTGLPPVEEMIGRPIDAFGILTVLTNDLNQIRGVQLLIPEKKFFLLLSSDPTSARTAPTNKVQALREVMQTPKIAATNAPRGSIERTMAAELLRYGFVARGVRVQGTILHVIHPRHFFMADETGPVVVHLDKPASLQRGDLVSVWGVPHAAKFHVHLGAANCERIGSGVLPEPKPVQRVEDSAIEWDGRRIRVAGRVVSHTRTTWNSVTNESLVVQLGDRTFDALLPLGTDLQKSFPPGTEAEFVGVCEVDADLHGKPHGFRVFLQSPADATVRARPQVVPAREWRGMMTALAAVTIVGALAFAWVLSLRSQVRRRAGELLTANARLTREIDEHARSEKVQQALYAISEAIHGVEDLPSLYARIHEIIGTLMPARNFYLALHDPAADLVSFPYHQDQVDPPPAPRQSRRGMTEYVLRTGRAALADLEEIARLKASGEYIQSGAPAKIWLGVPLSTGGRTFGVMAVQDHHDARAYGEEEKQILAFVAGQTALAIERKRAEHDLRIALASEKELNQLKSTFVSMVSHEFRTPLGVIQSSSDILDRYFDRLPPEKRGAQLRSIRKAVGRMSDLMEEVLLLARLDNNLLPCRREVIEVGKLCRRCVADVTSASSDKCPIQLVLEPPAFLADLDESLLVHVLQNLLSNAVKYSPPQSPVVLRVWGGPDRLTLEVADRGCGIPALDQPRLFTGFYRGSNTGSTPGSGLGLVIVKRCLDLHGGSIRLESVEGQGTTITLEVPIHSFQRTEGAGTPDTDLIHRPNARLAGTGAPPTALAEAGLTTQSPKSVNALSSHE